MAKTIEITNLSVVLKNEDCIYAIQTSANRKALKLFTYGLYLKYLNSSKVMSIGLNVSLSFFFNLCIFSLFSFPTFLPLHPWH